MIQFTFHCPRSKLHVMLKECLFLFGLYLNILLFSWRKPFADNRGPKSHPDGGLLCRMWSSSWPRLRGWTKTHRTQVRKELLREIFKIFHHSQKRITKILYHDAFYFNNPCQHRYCVNSASLEFQAATTSEGETAAEEAPLITYTATLGGCGGVDGVCKRPPKPNKETSVN